MPKYEVQVRVWDLYVLEVDAENETEAEEIAIENATYWGTCTDGGRDLEDIEEIEEIEED